MNHCLIPIKEDSVRLPNKNFNLFFDKPIFYYPLLEAYKSEIFKSIDFISSGEKIKAFDFKPLTEASNVKIKIIKEKSRRPKKRTLSDVVYDYLKKKHLKKGKLCVMLPTSVFVKAEDLKRVAKIGKNTLRAFYGKPVDKKVLYSYVEGERLSDKYENKTSENLPQPYVDAGQMYWIDIEDFLKNPIILTKKAAIYYASDSVDIDTKEDWEKAETLYKELFIS